MKYVLMFAETEEFAKELAALSQPELEQAYERVNQWFIDHADKLRSHSKLQHPGSATTVRLGGPEPVTTDGPFMEGKEVITGVAEIEVADLDEALRMVKAWPACPTVEIRPVQG
ncbi:YciI family protein [Kribbella deserti]|uniref:YciI family protein n=1 Tax=Kribbella deserti TaxID=1926257 RepID=A0ABV6QGU1_9ACTN